MNTAPLPLVRLAAPEDEEGILAMCRRLHTENGLFSLNEDKVRACLRRYYERAGVIVGVVGPPGVLEASTCLELTNFYYTDDWHLAELWNFVDTPYRRAGLRNAEALIQFGKSCSIQMKMPLFTGIITNRQMAGKVRLYRRLLGCPTGAFFVYNSTRWKSEPMEDHSVLRTRLREKAKVAATTPRPEWGRADTRQEVYKLYALLKEQASLLREAADAIDEGDHLWGTKKDKADAA